MVTLALIGAWHNSLDRMPAVMLCISSVKLLFKEILEKNKPALWLVPKVNEVEDMFRLGIGTAPGLEPEPEPAGLMSTNWILCFDGKKKEILE